MDITPYIEGLRQDLAAAAEGGGNHARLAAERLALALDPAVRLALYEALSHAAAEITQDLAAGSVEVRLKGREPQFVVDVPAPAPSPAELSEVADGADEELGRTVRLTLRLPESVKARAEEAASRAGKSLNSWLVQVVHAATKDRESVRFDPTGRFDVDIDLSSIPMPPGRGGLRRGKRITGWAR